MGIGFTGYESPQPSQLLHMLVKVKKYSSGSFEMTETNPPAKAAVCHGDSGGPLIKRSPWTGRPYVMGVLSRIFNAYDPNPKNATCPFSYDKTTDVTTDGYVNTAYFLSWIANTTGLTEQFLTTPPMSTAAPDVALVQNGIPNLASIDVPLSFPTIIVTCIFIFNLFYLIV
jgi:hypothetical protein